MGVPRHTSRPGVGTAELRASRLATWLMNYLADQRGTRAMRLRERVLELARQLWIRYSDPIVRIEVSGSYLLMPLSHELPMYMKRFPLYSQAVGRIAGYLAEASRTPITMVDIGANVGDTAAIVRSYCEIPVLCVEGHPRYCEILRRNITFVGADIAMSSTFVGSGDVDVAGSWEYGHGTAKFIEGGGERVRARSLSSVLRDHSAFR